MAVFAKDEFEYGRLDCQALAGSAGVISITERYRKEWRCWLGNQGEQGYEIFTLDFTAGIDAVTSAINEKFRWREEFGYEYGAQLNLDALNDGFHFDVSDDGGLVLELNRPDVLWDSHARWIRGLLSIASNHSRYQMLFGKRFFTMVVVSDSTHADPTFRSMFEAPFGTTWIPVPRIDSPF